MYVFRCGAFALDRLLLLLLLLTMSCYSTVIEPELKATQHMNPSQLFFFKLMKLKQLEIALQDLNGFDKPNVKLEQYETTPHLAGQYQ